MGLAAANILVTDQVPPFLKNGSQPQAELQYISTDEQVANILTKSLGRGKFVFFRDKLGVVQNTFLGKREY